MSGLEIASFALAVAATAESLTDNLVSGIKDTAKYGSGYEKARLALSLEATTFKSIKRVLFGNGIAISSSLFTAFEKQTQIDILNVLRLFKETLESKYSLEFSGNQDPRSRSPSLLDVTDSSIGFGSYHSASIVRRLKWGFSEKSKIDMTRQELHSWNEQLLNIIKIQMIENRVEKLNSQSQRYPTSSPAPFIQLLFGSDSTTEANSLGLEIDLKLSEMSLIRPGEASLPNLEMGSVEAYAIRNSRAFPTGDSRRLVQIRDSFVLIEYKPFNVGASQHGPSPDSSKRVNHLVNILHQEKPDRYHCMTARGFYADPSQFALCFDIPKRLNPEYQSLSALYKKLPEPDLEARFILARELCTALWHFHTVEWIHKFFCSSNILFFNDKDSPELQSALSNPYLFGWEYSRPETGMSSRHFDKDDIESNVYRHPEQWGLPTMSFNRMHDIYSLGVVLLEVGLWKPAVSLHRKGFQNVDFGSDVKEYLIASANHQRLRAAMGRKYQAIVLTCLKGRFSGCDRNDKALDLETFKNEIINVLDAMISSIGAA